MNTEKISAAVRSAQMSVPQTYSQRADTCVWEKFRVLMLTDIETQVRSISHIICELQGKFLLRSSRVPAIPALFS